MAEKKLVKKSFWRLIEVNRARPAAKETVALPGRQRRPWGCFGGVRDGWGGLISALVGGGFYPTRGRVAQNGRDRERDEETERGV